MLYQLDQNHVDFPPLDCALTEPNGLLALGGDLSPQRLVNAYRHGVFPWFSEGDPLLWWSPNPRAIIKLEHLRINRTLKKAINKSPYRITLNTAFTQVIKLCANAPFRADATWIVPAMQNAYRQLHQLGYAHSIEIWQEKEPAKQSLTEQSLTKHSKHLVGGLYGIAINGFFSGESMFYTQPNASKFALVALANLLKQLGVSFIDCQLLNPFLADMGATEVSRAAFVDLKNQALATTVSEDFWQARTLA